MHSQLGATSLLLLLFFKSLDSNVLLGFLAAASTLEHASFEVLSLHAPYIRSDSPVPSDVAFELALRAADAPERKNREISSVFLM